jgi:hypothetical protein
VSATVDPRGAAAPPAPADGSRRTRGPAPTPAPGATSGRAPKSKVAWYWRVVAWIVAVPLGLVVTGWPAYHFKGIRKDDLLDVFVGTGTGRYARLAAFTLVWALVTALLVQLFVEGGRWLAARRRARQAMSSEPHAPGPAPKDVPASPGRPPASARR